MVLIRKRSVFSSAWAALVLGFAALGLTGLAFIGERAGVPTTMLRFLLTVSMLGTLLGFGVSSLIVEPQRWSLADRSVRGVSAAPAMIVLALTMTWITASSMPAALPAALFAGCLVGLLLHVAVFGPRMRRIGALSPGRMLSLRFAGWEGLPLRILTGALACLLLAGLVLHVIGLIAERFMTDLSLSSVWAKVMAACVLFLPAWAGGMTTLIRLCRIGLALSLATLAAALLIGTLLPGSATAALPLFPTVWDHTMTEAMQAGLLAIIFLPALMPVLASLSTPRSNYRLAGWIAALGACMIAAMLWIGIPNADPGTAAPALNGSELAPLLLNMAGLAMLTTGGGLLLFALCACFVDDLVLSVMDEPRIVKGRLLAWRRFAMMGALTGLIVMFLLFGQNDPWMTVLDRIALPIFVAMAIAIYPPALLWSGTSGIGALSGLLIASLSQVVLLVVFGAGAPSEAIFGLGDGLACGLFGATVTLVVSLIVPPRKDAWQTAAAMAQTDEETAFDPRSATARPMEGLA